MQCPACGCTNPAGARFCLHCGTALTGKEQAAVQTPVLPAAVGMGRYTVLGLLAEDGPTQVYRAYDAQNRREVAVTRFAGERLSAAGHARMQHAAAALLRLGRHPCILTVHELGVDDDHPFLVNDLPMGRNLAALLAETPEHPLPLEQTLRIGAQLCRALTHAHARGCVHGALEPSQVWLAPDGSVRLGGFGLAAACAAGDPSTLSGSVNYLAPEQALDNTPSSPSDLYALGALLYELTTGRPPFPGDDRVAVISRHLSTAPVAPSWRNAYLPQPLDALILRLLAKDPANRPTAAEVGDALAGIDILAGSPYHGDQHLERAEANPLDRLAAGVFVGREHELRHLRAAFDAAYAGLAGVSLLSGEPGIGKTTLAEETATYAQLQGGQPLWGRCYEWEGAPAYWPWVQIIRAYVQDCDPQLLRAELGAGAADIAQLVPELRERLPDLPPLPRVEGEQARFRLFDGIAGFLRNATARRPLLLVLDDLHWADSPSLLLLQFIAHELEQVRLLIVGTYRDVEIGRRHPLSATLAELARGRRTQRLALHGLAAPDIARFIALLTSSEPDQALVDEVQRETEGNPFFVSEVVRLLVSEGRLGRTPRTGGLSHGIPESVRDVVGRRLDRLSERCNEILAVASVEGREFTLAVLERVSELTTDTILDALEEALRARLIDFDQLSERYRFTHALVQDTLYAELGGGQRLRLHAAVGRAIEQQYAATLAPHYGALAYHFGLAAAAGNSAQAIEYAIKAGEQAMTQVAWETAIQHYQRALYTLEHQAEPDPALRCDILLALGSAQYHTVLDTSESPDGRQSYLQAAELAKTIGSFERLARAALGFAGLNAVRTAGGLQQVRLFEAALELAPPGDNALTARVMARLAVDYRLAPGTAERTVELSDAALAMARRIGNAAVLAPVLLARFSAIWRPETAVEQAAVAAEAWQAADAAGDTFAGLWARQFAGFSLYQLGDADFEQTSLAVLTATRESRIPYFFLIEEIHRAGRAIKDGRWEDAEAGMARFGGDSQALITLYARAILLFHIRREQGRLGELDSLMRSVSRLAGESDDPFDRHRAHIAEGMLMLRFLDAGLTDDARHLFETYAGRRFVDLVPDPYWLTTVALLSEACAGLEDRPRAAFLYELLLPYARHNANPASAACYFGSVSYQLGLLATLLTDWDAAARHFEQALEMNTHMRARPVSAWTCFAWAELLGKRGNPANAHAAHALLAQARETAHALDMPRLSRRVDELAVELDALPRSAGHDAAGGLSQRELEVLRLVVTGRSDREIAAALFISPRTVSTHVTNIFGKLGVNSRAEATAFAVRHELV